MYFVSGLSRVTVEPNRHRERNLIIHRHPFHGHESELEGSILTAETGGQLQFLARAHLSGNVFGGFQPHLMVSRGCLFSCNDYLELD